MRPAGRGLLTPVLKDWFDNCFVPEVENFIEEKNQFYKVLLIIDNAYCHKLDFNHPNIKIIFFPPNFTSLIQFLAQGIIQTFKMFYSRSLFKVIFDRMEENENKPLTQV